MEWIVIAVVIGIVILVALLGLTAKHHEGRGIPGRFDFDRYKAEELSRRGLFDKTKW